jgi:hypothetical protein
MIVPDQELLPRLHIHTRFFANFASCSLGRRFTRLDLPTECVDLSRLPRRAGFPHEDYLAPVGGEEKRENVAESRGWHRR